MAWSTLSLLAEAMATEPSSSMSMVAPVRAMMSLFTLPPGPMTSLMRLTGMRMVVILVPEDVGEDGDAARLLDEAHRDAGDGRADRHARVHQREAAAAHRGHRAGTVRLEDVADHAEGVRELVVRRQDGAQRALGQD